ncbi:MAG: YraN family protein [Acidimicrobiales bacterium]
MSTEDRSIGNNPTEWLAKPAVQPRRKADRVPGSPSTQAGWRRTLGAQGEAIAADWYQARGYEVLARNWRRREGEIDLVLRQGSAYVFAEVKTRTTDAFGVPAESVNRDKQARLRRLAARWLREDSPGPASEIRFDVVSILGGRIEVLEGAF